jgi:hypothetical protein
LRIGVTMSWEEIERMPPHVRRKYLEIIRAIPPGRKLEIAAGFSASVKRIVRSAIRAKHPEATEEDIRKEYSCRVLPAEIRRKVYGW